MVKKIKFYKLIVGFLVATFVSTSMGGAFIASALAAEATEDSTNSQAVVGGLLAVGLISMLSHNHADNSGTGSAKTAVNNTTASTTTTNNNTRSNTGTSASTSTGTDLASMEKQAFTLLNQDRQANGLKALALNSSLTKLGENYAQDMINRNYFSHYNPEGQSPFDRMKAAGISYSYAGENIAINNTVPGAETAFMNSSGHRANILNTNYTEVGIGIRKSSNGSLYVVQEFIGK